VGQSSELASRQAAHSSRERVAPTTGHDDFLYRLSHPLGEHVIEAAKAAPTPPAELRFDIAAHPGRIAVVEALKGRSGVLSLTRLTVESFESEDYLLFSAVTDDGQSLDQETCERLFGVDSNAGSTITLAPAEAERIKAEAVAAEAARLEAERREKERLAAERAAAMAAKIEAAAMAARLRAEAESSFDSSAKDASAPSMASIMAPGWAREVDRWSDRTATSKRDSLAGSISRRRMERSARRAGVGTVTPSRTPTPNSSDQMRARADSADSGET
jgi:hypothetical protein